MKRAVLIAVATTVAIAVAIFDVREIRRARAAGIDV